MWLQVCWKQSKVYSHSLASSHSQGVKCCHSVKPLASHRFTQDTLWHLHRDTLDCGNGGSYGDVFLCCKLNFSTCSFTL